MTTGRREEGASARTERKTTPAVGAAGAAVAIGYGWWAVSLPPFSASATIAVLAAGLAGSIAGYLSRKRERPRCSLRQAVPWLVVAAVGGLWQLAAYVQAPREDHPTLSSLTNALLDSRPARAAAFAAWLLGALLLARRR